MLNALLIYSETCAEMLCAVFFISASTVTSPAFVEMLALMMLETTSEKTTMARVIATIFVLMLPVRAFFRTFSFFCSFFIKVFSHPV